MNAIYLFELLQLVAGKTGAVVYTPPLLFADPIEGKKFLINYQFKGCKITDLQETLLAINRLGIDGHKQIKYMGESNIERLSSFFVSHPVISSEEQLLKFETDTPEIVLACFYGSKWGKRKRPFLCFTTCGAKCYKKARGRLKFEHRWTDPDLTLEVSLLSVNILYKKKKVGYVYWNVIDIPLIDTLAAIGMQKIYPSADTSCDGA